MDWVWAPMIIPWLYCYSSYYFHRPSCSWYPFSLKGLCKLYEPAPCHGKIELLNISDYAQQYVCRFDCILKRSFEGYRRLSPHLFSRYLFFTCCITVIQGTKNQLTAVGSTTGTVDPNTSYLFCNREGAREREREREREITFKRCSPLLIFPRILPYHSAYSNTEASNIFHY